MSLLSLFGCTNTQDEVVYGPTLPGADEIYPTILFDEILPQMYRDVTLENVQISSDDPYEGMITSIGDFNEDGITEKIVVDYRDILAERNVSFRYIP